MSTKTKFIDKQGSTLQRLPLQAGRMFFTREILLDSIQDEFVYTYSLVIHTIGAIEQTSVFSRAPYNY